MSVINTNVSSLQAQNSLKANETKLSSAMARLSSGIRINSAKDDAAGLAITTRMTSEVRGLTQAVRNANDGISVAQTAEGSLGEITNILQRLREIAVQSANASNNGTDRSFLNTEAQQLIQETQRIGTQTNFNGIKLLDGTFSSKDFQVGANQGEVITFNTIADSTAAGLGAHKLKSVTSGTGLLGKLETADAGAIPDNETLGRIAGEGFKIQTSGGGISDEITYADKSGADVIAAAINAKATDIGVTAVARNSTTLSNLNATGTTTVTMELNGKAITATVADKNDLTALVAAINGVTSDTKVSASFTNAIGKSSITLTSRDGSDITVKDFATGTAGDSIDMGGDALTDGGDNSNRKVGTVELTSTQGQVTTVNAEVNLFGATGSNNSVIASIETVDISSQAGASDALSVIDAALTQVNNTRAALGGLINRFEATVSNQNTTIMNLSASRSRILDTDYAVETTNLAKAQIIQQAATAMLAQANQSSQSVLALLK